MSIKVGERGEKKDHSQQFFVNKEVKNKNPIEIKIPFLKIKKKNSPTARGGTRI